MPSRISSPDKRPRSFARRLGAGLAIVFVLVLLAMAAVVLGLRHRLAITVAPLEGTLRLAGLSAPVTIRRDAHGVPHIEAENVNDLLLAQGWVTASDRLWQMDMARRLPAGEAAEVLGQPLVKHDTRERILGLRDVAARMERTMPQEQRAQLEAYARGVNAFLAAQQLPAEFSLLMYKPRPWRPLDSILVALSMAEMLDERWPVKIEREQVEARLRAHGDTALAADLYPTGSWRDHPPVPNAPGISDPQEVPEIPLDPSQTKAQPPLLPVGEVLSLSSLCASCRPGSNEWAVSGVHTASGKPLLANDMHLGHSIPDVWYESELHAGSFHVAGVTVPGLPFIAVGHNDHIAWGFTALGGDTQDVYVEGGAPGTGVGTALIPERIRVRGGRDVDLNVERTTRGPVITPLLPGERRVLSLHWAIYDDAAQGLPLYALDSALDWASFRAAASHWWAPTLNVAYADDAGHIGYQAVGLIPTRAGGLQGVPAPAAIGQWTGYVPFDALPSILDPEGGIVATANSRITPDGYPYPLTLDWASPYRNERIYHWLNSKQKLTRADMVTLQTDVYSEVDQEIAQRMAYAIDHAPHAGARAREAADILRSWNGVMGVDSPAAAIVTRAEEAFWPAVLGAKIGDGWKLYDWSESTFAREQMITGQPAAWLPPAYRSWNEFLLALVEGAIQDGPTHLRDWRYGAKHTIAMEHPLWRLLPGAHAEIGPLPQSGGLSTVKQVSGNLGPSQRFTADFGNLDGATENIVMGESGDPASPYFRDQWASWYGGTTFSLPFSPVAVAAAARHTLRLVP